MVMVYGSGRKNLVGGVGENPLLHGVIVWEGGLESVLSDSSCLGTNWKSIVLAQGGEVTTFVALHVGEVTGVELSYQ